MLKPVTSEIARDFRIFGEGDHIIRNTTPLLPPLSNGSQRLFLFLLVLLQQLQGVVGGSNPVNIFQGFMVDDNNDAIANYLKLYC